jgi:sugar phosphate isomerase/epimerase
VKDYSFEYLVHNYFPVPKESFVVNIASLDENIHQRSIKHIKDSIDFCSKINARLYTFHPGFLTDPKGSNPSNQNYDFQWDNEFLKKANYEMAWERMVVAFQEIIHYAREKQVTIAFETEGSFHKKDHLMMQQPKEYERFLKLFSSDAIGINLNIGHLILAANTFGFSYQTFVDLIADYVVAMELSHNNGVEDQHLPLQSDGWYWSLILDKRFSEVKKILEFRNTNILKIKETLQLFS